MALRMIAILAMVLVAGAAASAADDPLAAYQSAVAALNGAPPGTPPPLLSDPAAAPTIRAAFDDTVVPKIAALPGGQSFELCTAGLTAAKRYLDWVSGGQTSGFTPAQVEQIHVRERQYENEIALGMRLIFACVNVEADAAAGIWPKLPEAKRGELRGAAAQMRGGLAKEYAAAILMQGDPISPGARQKVLDAALAYGDVGVGHLSLQDRAMVAAKIDMELAKPPAGAWLAGLKKLKALMQRTDCTGLCPI